MRSPESMIGLLLAAAVALTGCSETQLTDACAEFCAEGNVCLASTGEQCEVEYCDPIFAEDLSQECKDYFRRWFGCMTGVGCGSEAMWECCDIIAPFDCQATIVNQTCGSP